MIDKVTSFCIASYLVYHSCYSMRFNEKKIHNLLLSFDPSLQIHISVSSCSCTSLKPRNNLPKSNSQTPGEDLNILKQDNPLSIPQRGHYGVTAAQGQNEDR